MASKRTTGQGDRGYGPAHRQLRRYWDKYIKAGNNPPCSLCPYPILSTDQWDLDHTDDRTGYRGPAHSHCNRRAGAIKKNKIYGQRLPVQPKRPDKRTREW